MFTDVRFRRSLAAIIALVLVGAVLTAVWPRHKGETVAAAATTTTTTTTSTTTTSTKGNGSGSGGTSP